jgi:hypothetical protein
MDIKIEKLPEPGSTAEPTLVEIQANTIDAFPRAEIGEVGEPDSIEHFPAGSSSAPAEDDGRREVMQWAVAKGHIPPPPGKAYQFRNDPHKGKPHVAVVMAHGDGKGGSWPRNKLVSEAEYDKAVRDSYGLSVRDTHPTRKAG